MRWQQDTILFVFKMDEQSPSVELKYNKGPFNSSGLRDFVVAADSTMYLLSKQRGNSDQEFFYELESRETATDFQLCSRLESPPPNGTTGSLVVAVQLATIS